MKLSRIIYVICCIIVCSILLFACNTNNVSDENDIPNGIFTITQVERNVKHTTYGALYLRVFNPVYAISNTNIDKGKYQECCKLDATSDYDYFFDKSKINNLPTYYYNKESELTKIKDAYYESIYADIFNSQTIKNKYQNSESFSYELLGFAYNMSIEKRYVNNSVEIITSVKDNIQLLHLDNSISEIGSFNPHLPNYSDNSNMNDFENVNIRKFSKYMCSGRYNNDVSYSICTIIFHKVTDDGFYVMNFIKLYDLTTDTSGYNLYYYINDLSYFDIGIDSEEFYQVESMDEFLTPLKDKLIDMVGSYLNHSFDYKN